jgi:hypothetical protein
MFHLTLTEWFFLLPFALAVLFMLWVFWNFTLQFSRKRHARTESRKVSVGPLRDAPVPRPTYRPESVPLHPTDSTHFEYRPFR